MGSCGGCAQERGALLHCRLDGQNGKPGSRPGFLKKSGDTIFRSVSLWSPFFFFRGWIGASIVLK